MQPIAPPMGGAKRPRGVQNGFGGAGGAKNFAPPLWGVQKILAAEGGQEITIIFVKIVLKNVFFVHISKNFRLRRIILSLRR